MKSTTPANASSIVKRILFALMLPLLLHAGAALALVQVTEFGSNPGALKMFKHVPANMPAHAPLVVALHGCTQNAAAYEATGWSALASNYKFYVVYPEVPTNSASGNACLNWFEPGDIARGQGEALSIKQMVDRMKADHSIDPSRVFVTGFSGGGSMTNVLLAAYPDVFAAGAPIAGTPYKCATSMAASFGCMSPGVDKTPTAWGELVRGAHAGYTGRKPRVSIWHGGADATVAPINLTETMEQWTNFHGIDQVADSSTTVGGYPRKVYKNGSGTALVETWSITGMNHGVAIDPGSAVQQCGTTGPYRLDANICSTWHIANFFGILATDPEPPTACHTASNYAHVTAGRAYVKLGKTYANGSRQYMGLYNTYVVTALKQTGPNYYVIGCS